MFFPSELHPFLFSQLDIQTKRLINKEVCKNSPLEYGLNVKFSWELISYYFDKLEYPLMILKTYHGIIEGRMEQMIYIVLDDNDYYVTFNIQELQENYSYDYMYIPGKIYRYSDKTTYDEEHFKEFKRECIPNHRPIKLEDERDVLCENAHYDIDLDNKKVILTILGCDKEILLKEVHAQYQEKNSIRKRLWFELNSSRLIDNFWDYYESTDLYHIFHSGPDKMIEDIDQLYRSIIDAF